MQLSFEDRVFFKDPAIIDQIIIDPDIDCGTIYDCDIQNPHDVYYGIYGDPSHTYKLFHFTTMNTLVIPFKHGLGAVKNYSLWVEGRRGTLTVFTDVDVEVRRK